MTEEQGSVIESFLRRFKHRLGGGNERNKFSQKSSSQHELLKQFKNCDLSNEESTISKSISKDETWEYILEEPLLKNEDDTLSQCFDDVFSFNYPRQSGISVDREVRRLTLKFFSVDPSMFPTETESKFRKSLTSKKSSPKIKANVESIFLKRFEVDQSIFPATISANIVSNDCINESIEKNSIVSNLATKQLSHEKATLLKLELDRFRVDVSKIPVLPDVSEKESFCVLSKFNINPKNFPDSMETPQNEQHLGKPVSPSANAAENPVSAEAFGSNLYVPKLSTSPKQSSSAIRVFTDELIQDMKLRQFSKEPNLFPELLQEVTDSISPNSDIATKLVKFSVDPKVHPEKFRFQLSSFSVDPNLIPSAKSESALKDTEEAYKFPAKLWAFRSNPSAVPQTA